MGLPGKGKTRGAEDGSIDSMSKWYATTQGECSDPAGKEAESVG